MRHSWRLRLTLVLFVLPVGVAGQETGFLDRSAVVEGTEYLYQIYVPRAYGGSSEWPVILYLHGCGPSAWGEDGVKQTRYELADAIRADTERFPALVVLPQMPLGTHWLGVGANVARAALQRTIDEYRIDESRLYLMGFSCGANGAWKLAYEEPERFAALVPVSGWARRRDNGRGTVYPAIATAAGPDEFSAVARRVREIPTWILHGADDVQVQLEEAQGMWRALAARGAPVRYTEMPGVAHRAAIADALQTDGLVTWLLQQRKAR